jgi:hypothetical protein
METGASGHLDLAIEALKACDAALRQVAETCCLPERSGLIARASESLREAIQILSGGSAEPEILAGSLAAMARCGAGIGELYVTCCTETREPLYRRILDGLNKAHGAVTGGKP